MITDNKMTDAFNFRKAVEGYYDFVIEVKIPEQTLIYDKDHIKDILNTDREFNDMNELFWFVVSNYIHPEDLENVDMFRKVDISRRIENNQHFLETEFRLKVKNGNYIWISSIFVFLLDEEKKMSYVLGLFKNINEKKNIELECTQLARKDAMTRLYNKTYVQHIIMEELEKITNGNQSAMLIVDIDNFKNVNDMYGHFIGDRVIIEFANRILETTREDDIVGRIGGDEFVIYMKNIPSRDILDSKLQRIISNLDFQFVEQGVNTHIRCSIGAVLCNKNLSDYNEAYQKADRGLYIAKSDGKNTYRIFG